jgi:transcriptional regulator with XRE-family HTH domain
MNIGARLRDLRIKASLSQGDVEKRTGLRRCYVSRVEHGFTVPLVETLEKFARAFGVPLYQLFTEKVVGVTPPADLAVVEAGVLPELTAQDRSYVKKLIAQVAKMRDRELALFLALATTMLRKYERRPRKIPPK